MRWYQRRSTDTQICDPMADRLDPAFHQKASQRIADVSAVSSQGCGSGHGVDQAGGDGSVAPLTGRDAKATSRLSPSIRP